MMQMVDFVAHLFWGQSPEDWTDFMVAEGSFQTTTVADLMLKPRARKRLPRDPAPPIDSECSTFSALEVMAKSDVSHMAVLNKEKQIVGILTRSMLISWLSQDPEWLAELGTMKVADMRKSRVVTVQDTEAAINAFYKMLDFDVDGVAVVDSEGTLRSAVSARDLRGVGVNGTSFSRLFKSIPVFKRLMKLDYPTLIPGDTGIDSKGTPRKPSTASPHNASVTCCATCRMATLAGCSCARRTPTSAVTPSPRTSSPSRTCYGTLQTTLQIYTTPSNPVPHPEGPELAACGGLII